MGTAYIFNKIKKNKYYLLRHYSLDFISTLVVIVVMANLRTDSSVMSVSSLIFVIPGILTGLMISSLLHNTSHNNIQNTFINRVVGQISGYWVLYGYKNFVMIHLLHHIHSDKEHDPVNPQGMNFLVFLSAPMRYMIKATKKYLYSVHGHGPLYQKIMSAQTIVFHGILFLRLIAWYMLLGNELFFFFYLPGLLSNIMIYAHINYVCHRDKEDGSVEIVNLNHNLYYRFANFITVGGYYHKNHHHNPGLFDPRLYANKRFDTAIYSKMTEPQNGKKPLISSYFNIHDVWGERLSNFK